MNTDVEIRHVTPADGNVFADLGFDIQEADKLKLKAQLAIQISEWVKREQLKQEDAAKILGVSRPRVSDVVNGKTSKFTIDTLVDMVECTGHHVVLQVV